MKFRYIGKEHSTFMGFEWIKGTVHDVTDPHAIGKLSNSVLFEKADGPAAKGGKGSVLPKAPRVASAEEEALGDD